MPARVPKSWSPQGGSDSKYQARATVIDGIRFASKKEAARYCELRMLKLAGEIAELELQVSIGLMGADGPLVSDKGRALTYRADFMYHDLRTGKRVIEDAKGFKTPEYKLKKAILQAQGVTVREV